jgi:Na+/H+-dicarboxylate symporter
MNMNIKFRIYDFCNLINMIAAGIPPVAIVLLLGVDRILDMTRTMVNVTGDLTACLFFDKRIKADELPETDPLPPPKN